MPHLPRSLFALVTCIAVAALSAPTQQGGRTEVEELRQRARRLERELETYRLWKAQGGIAERLRSALGRRVLAARIADAGESRLPITGRARARQLRLDEREKLADDAIVVVGKEVIQQSHLDPLMAYLASYPREDGEVEQGRLAMTELLKGALVRDMFGPATAAARRLAKQVYDRAVAGESFADLAQAHSAGPGKDAGGEIGWVTRGSGLDIQVEARVFGLEEGDTAKPVTTPLGYAIVRVTDIQPAGDDAPERRAVRMILIPYVDELEELEQAGAQIDSGQTTILYRTPDILPLLPPQYR